MGFGSCHTEIYRSAERQLHAVAVQRRAVFLRFHALRFNVRIVFPKDLQPVRLTDFIARFSQIGKKKFIVMQFPTVIKVVGAYDNVIVKPTLSREKCVCLQNLNKILCVLDNKSQSDIYRQSVQKEFKRFFI